MDFKQDVPIRSELKYRFNIVMNKIIILSFKLNMRDCAKT